MHWGALVQLLLVQLARVALLPERVPACEEHELDDPDAPDVDWLKGVIESELTLKYSPLLAISGAM